MIAINDAIIDPELAGVLADDIGNRGFKYGWRSTQSYGYAHWNNEIVKCSKKNISPIVLDAPWVNAWHLLKRAVTEAAYPIRCYANCHVFGCEGYPHNDSERDNETTIIVYLNKEWKREWGGETMFYEGQEIIQSVMPRFGRAVIFPSNLWHCARAVTRICPVERVTFVLKARHPQGDSDLVMLEKFLITVGAGQKPHRHGTLKDHLIRCYEILKAKDVSRETALAAGLHSIMGTNIYKDACVSNSDFIGRTFGPVVADLVTRFSSLTDRPACLSNGGADSELRLIEWANLKDQDSLKKWPGIAKAIT